MPNHIIHGQNISNHCNEEIQSKNTTTKDVRNVCKHTILFSNILFKDLKMNIY